MDFTGGQVLNIKNLSEHIKGLKTNKEKRIKKQELTEQLKKTQEEIKILNRIKRTPAGRTLSEREPDLQAVFIVLLFVFFYCIIF